MLIVDGHADIAWNMLTYRRDYTLPLAEIRAREQGTDVATQNGTATLAWEEWIRGGVALLFASLYATPVREKLRPWESSRYADAEQAHQLYLENVNAYCRLLEAHPEKFRLVLGRKDLREVIDRWQTEPPRPQVGLVLLMEGAECVRHPGELPMWKDRGVRIVGPAWMATRYAGGTKEPGPFTAAGWELLEVMADLEMVLDISHLAEQAVLQALDRYPRTVLASHSNPRALLPSSEFPDRHLTDEAIVGLARRGGVMGIVIGNRFLKDGWKLEDGRESVTMGDIVAQIDYVCQLLGSADHVGIGSDFDGGYGRELIPDGLDSVADLRLIGLALMEKGYGQQEADAILGGNWLRLLAEALPED